MDKGSEEVPSRDAGWNARRECGQCFVHGRTQGDAPMDEGPGMVREVRGG